MDLERLQKKKMAILGLGLENYALVNFLIGKKISSEITICDARKKEELGERYKDIEGEEVKWRLGKNYDKGLDKFDVIFRIAGYPLFSQEIQRAKKAGVEITSPVKLFFELCPTKNIIGVTGTKGKGTVSTLINLILKKSGKRAWLGGNIGVAPFEFINKVKKNDWVVLELSSFQLEDLEVSPKIAVITNFYKEHLKPADPNNPNYHISLGKYWQAKSNIFKHQKRGDILIVNNDLKKARLYNLAFKGKGRKVYFGKSDLPSKLIGEHNKENVAAAVEVAKMAGVRGADIKKAVANFRGLEHRLEFVRSLGGVKYYNDSFATTPESAIIALKSFDAPIVLLAGGADKGADFKPMARGIKKQCKAIILLKGEGTERLRKDLLFIPSAGLGAGIYHLSSFEFSNLKLAVEKARFIAEKGDVVLLSPGCASFGMFRNYKERGELFKNYVKNLK